MWKIYRYKYLRMIALFFLKAFDRDIIIKHHWTFDLISLSLFKHKGYWFYGKQREYDTMLLFQQLIPVGNNIVEVGGHIGYVTLFFNKLVFPSGWVTVFEPGSNNLPYILSNTKNIKSISVQKKAVGNNNCKVEFFEENLTGQNNSVVENFEGFLANQQLSYVESSIEKKVVPMVTLDSSFQNKLVDFIKIDIEGGEYNALLGAQELLKKQKPMLMVEIQADEKEIYELLTGFGYLLFSPNRTLLKSYNQLRGNVFCLHNDKHKNKLKTCFY